MRAASLHPGGLTRWPPFGRQTTLNAATCCATVSSVSAGQQRNGEATDVCEHSLRIIRLDSFGLVVMPDHTRINFHSD